MGKVKFQIIGSGKKKVTAKGQESIHIQISPEFLFKMPLHDWENIWMFPNKNNNSQSDYTIFGLIGEIDLIGLLEKKKIEEYEGQKSMSNFSDIKAGRIEMLDEVINLVRSWRQINDNL